MEVITIEGKDYKCSKRVLEEFEWVENKVNAAKRLSEKIQDLQDDLDTITIEYQTKINLLLIQISNL